MHRALTPASAADDRAFFALVFCLNIKGGSESSTCIAFAPARRERGVRALVKPVREARLACGASRALAAPLLAFTLRAAPRAKRWGQLEMQPPNLMCADERARARQRASPARTFSLRAARVAENQFFQ